MIAEIHTRSANHLTTGFSYVLLPFVMIFSVTESVPREKGIMLRVKCVR